jgi:cyclic beta-1,2-glucan synthetase
MTLPPPRITSFGGAPSLDDSNGPAPPSRILSNACYRVLITSAGTGFSAIGDHLLTHWSGDRVEDPHGFFIYLRDLESRDVWSAGLQPTLLPAGSYQSRWRPGVFEIERDDFGIQTLLQVCVPPDETVELRRLTLTNTSRRQRTIELTSFAEVVLNDPAAHAAHPAFSKLFLQTEYDSHHGALLARRRPRSAERHPWMVHALLGPRQAEFETDRGAFLGRGHTLRMPRALRCRDSLSGTVGNVLDPALSLRCVTELKPDETVSVTFLLGAAAKRINTVAFAKQYSSPQRVEEGFARARTYEDGRLESFGIDSQGAEYLQSLAGAVMYGHPKLRGRTELRVRAKGDPAELTRYDLAPKRPMVLLHAETPAGAGFLDVFHKAHGYWKALGLPIDVLILCDESTPKATEDLRTLRLNDVAPSHRDLIDSVARLVVTDSLPDLGPAPAAPESSPAVVSSAGATPSPEPTHQEALAHARDPGERLDFFNGYGGFSNDGREYVIPLPWRDGRGLRLPPRPWINIVANESFGFLVSERGATHTWSGNSREHRLTPWCNDPLTDPHGEAFYVRDEETGSFWSPLPGPAPGPGPYEARHGFGYSTFHHTCDGLEQQVTLFVHPKDPVKISTLRIHNGSNRPRRLSLFSYYRLVLGALPEETGPFITTEWNADSQVLLARNPLAGEFSEGTAFAAVAASHNSQSVHVTCDRSSFIGRNGSPERPAALRAKTLDGRAGAGLDPCMAQQVIVEIPPGETTEVSFLFGEEQGHDRALSLIRRYGRADEIQRALKEVREFWQRKLSGVKITTPSRELDLMINGWLPYQTLACRIWARSALYQSGGAFGFRDQLQDAAALVYLSPDLTRQQVLLHAAHQFREGDVLHWWHPPKSRGLRTRFADDLLWLPHLSAFYIRVTGDEKVLEEEIPFLSARELEEGEDEAFLSPERSQESADLYEHCCRAIDRSLTRGEHGLPLFGSGDWNDGMNRVGREGKGESVWLGFFLYDILADFIPICGDRGDGDRAQRYSTYREQLLAALNDHGWDGDWYRRGFYDNGATLGSQSDDECKIDALAQAWSVLSGAAPTDRAAQAMDSVERHLISEEDGLIRLLTPPFDKAPNDPGYIKGYVRGVRENGGQYTHAALWVVRAMAELGRNNLAGRLLSMLNPISHTRSEEEVGVYQVEPYVIAADVYGEPPHVGRGGWTWYTGSSGWMYRVALESLLGFRIQDGETLVLKPCIQDDWPWFTIEYRLPGEETRYTVRVTKPRGSAGEVVEAAVDGVAAPVENGACRIALRHDGRVHEVNVVLGSAGARAARQS